jgi:hypothetical protein
VATLRDVIESFRRIGTPEADMPGKVAEQMGVSVDEVRAVLAEMRSSDDGYHDRAVDEDALADEVARLVVGRDQEFGRDLQAMLREHFEQWGDPMDMDPGLDERRRLRRLRGLDDALRRAFGE